MSDKEVVLNSSSRVIELKHCKEDPALWMVNDYRKFLFIKLKKSREWFICRSDAMEYAADLKQTGAE